MISEDEVQAMDESETRLKGVTICPGIGFGMVRCVDPAITIVKEEVGPARAPEEQKRYIRAVETLRAQLHEHIAQYHESSPSEVDAILRAHEMMLNDAELHNAVLARIASGHRNAEWAIEEEGERLIGQFERARNPYFQARAEDVRDLLDHLLRILSAKGPTAPTPPAGLRQDRVFVSGRLYPSDVVLAERSGALGFATESRALSSHAALLLKGFGIPAVGELAGLKRAAHDGDKIIVDALDGSVVLRPACTTLEKYQERLAKLQTPREPPFRCRCMTGDGTHIHLFANIENPRQAPFALQYGLEGVGLFRTEFLVLLSGKFPTEEEQYDIYRHVLDGAPGQPVTFRTFDIGADKQSPTHFQCTGQNPALGVRGIRRHLLRYPEELRTQMRAILRAAEGCAVRILLPMVTTLKDVEEAKAHFQAVKAGLRANHLTFNQTVGLGVMIEVPAAAIETRAILEQVDFISVGTNDLLQYFMAADRDNEEVLQYNDAENHGFLWLLEFIIGEAKSVGRDRDVMICGEMASRPEFIPNLLRLGYRNFSISPVSAHAVRDAVETVKLEESAIDR